MRLRLPIRGHHQLLAIFLRKAQDAATIPPREPAQPSMTLAFFSGNCSCRQMAFSSLRQPGRSYFAIFSVLSVWVVVLGVIAIDLSKRPNLGAKFVAAPNRSAMEVVAVYEDGPAAKAGLQPGRFITHFSTDAVSKTRLTGYEAMVGRHQLHDYGMIARAIDSKRQIWPHLHDPTLRLHDARGRTYQITPTVGRNLMSLPLKSYLTLLQSLVVMVITVGIWAFATPSRAVNFLTISGFGLATNAMCGAYLGSSLLTIPPEYFRGVINLAAWGFTVFSYGLLALLICFPIRLFRWPAGELLFACGVALQSAISFEVFELPFHSFQTANLLPIPLGIMASLMQWWYSREDPVARGSVMWFSLSIYGIVLSVVVLYSIPIMLLVPPIISPHWHCRRNPAVSTVRYTAGLVEGRGMAGGWVCSGRCRSGSCEAAEH